MKSFNVRLTEEAEADLLEMAEHVAGKPGNLAAGFYALVAEWRRLKAAEAARLDRAARLARHEEYVDAMEQHDRGVVGR